MKLLVFVTSLLFGSAIASPVLRAEPSTQKPSVEIIATYRNVTAPPLIVTLQALPEGLEPPLNYEWLFGNGHRWSGPAPLPQSYEPGRYDVLLTVTDAVGNVVRASVAIDSKSHGCGF